MSETTPELIDELRERFLTANVRPIPVDAVERLFAEIDRLRQDVQRLKARIREMGGK